MSFAQFKRDSDGQVGNIRSGRYPDRKDFAYSSQDGRALIPIERISQCSKPECNRRHLVSTDAVGQCCNEREQQPN